MIDINLLPAKALLSVAQKQYLRTMAISALALGIVVGAGLVVTLALGALLSSRISSLTQQRQELLAKFDSETPKLVDLFSLKDKITGIKRVQTVRPNLSSVIASQQGLLVDGVATTRLAINNGGRADWDVTVRDTTALSSYLSRLDSESAREFFKTLSVSGLQLGQNWGYSFSVSAEFDKSRLVSVNQ